MSLKEYKDVICEGDTAILYININSMYALEVESFRKNKNNELVENVFQTTFGALRVISLVGKKFGTKVELSRGWAFVLHPTPELWTLTLPHRTQIIYSLDISVIIHLLDLTPGHVVLESGTGSGSLSHALIRSVQPNGHVYTFDFHANRVAVAKSEFERHGLSELVTIQQRDVCADGFGDGVNGKANAVFLDLPHPWEAVLHVTSVFKDKGGRLCSFSPCIEQVQRTCDALHRTGFVEVQTLECLQKEFQVQARTFPILDTTNGCSGVQQGGLDQQKVVCGVPPATMPGHTGYLTVATLPPLAVRTDNSGTDGNRELAE